jgi:uncharacterized protein
VTVGFLSRFSIALVLFVLLFVPAVTAQDVPIPPAPTQYVTDTAGFLSPAVVDRLNARLRDYEQQTQHQVIVYIGATTGDVPIEDWANRAFEKWGVGRKDLDDGLALFIMAKDRRLRIEVGIGLEPDVGDLRSKRIIDEVIVPRIRAGDNAGAVEAGIEALIQLIQSPQAATGAESRARESRRIAPGQFILIGILAVIVLGALATSPAMVIWMLLSVLSGGNRRRGRRGGGGNWGGGFGGGFGGGGWGGGGGGWSGGGGGFSGGGGMSGGGGASGSW